MTQKNKSEFHKLLKTNYDDKYLKYLLDENSLSAKEYEEISNIFITSKDLKEREHELKKYFEGKKELERFGNPFYIWFGNPNSDILVIWKEKAFNPDDDQSLLIKESINNYSQWKTIVDHNLSKLTDDEINDMIGFSPQLPTVYHNEWKGRNHTWWMINRLTNVDGIVIEDDVSPMFRKCFLTELNHIPSKYSKWSWGKLIQVRKDFLSHSFYKTFPIVIIWAKTYLKKETKDILSDIFEIDNSFEEIYLWEIGKTRKRGFYIEKFKSKKQTIYVCNQLSGSTWWSDDILRTFRDELNKKQV